MLTSAQQLQTELAEGLASADVYFIFISAVMTCWFHLSCGVCVVMVMCTCVVMVMCNYVLSMKVAHIRTMTILP